jgi:hypothetical protein
MSYNARTDMACFIGWIGDRTLLTDLPAYLYVDQDNPDRLRAESLALGRMESYLRGDQYPVLVSAGQATEAEQYKNGIWSDENSHFLKGLLHVYQATL